MNTQMLCVHLNFVKGGVEGEGWRITGIVQIADRLYVSLWRQLFVHSSVIITNMLLLLTPNTVTQLL